MQSVTVASWNGMCEFFSFCLLVVTTKVIKMTEETFKYVVIVFSCLCHLLRQTSHLSLQQIVSPGLFPVVGIMSVLVISRYLAYLLTSIFADKDIC